jgi:oligopeptide/dipeptide ABC transporter ATP-binding protein
MQRMQQEFGTAIVLITHDLGVVADMADDVLVMYAGRAVETADRRTTFYEQHHPYTKGLLESLPTLDTDERLKPISGSPPSLLRLPEGCSFRPRCPYAFDRCVEVPPLRPVDDAGLHRSACWLPTDATGQTEAAERERLEASAASSSDDGRSSIDALRRRDS